MERIEQTQAKSALVLGATGGVGGAVTEALLARSWAVRGLARDPDAARSAWRHRVGGVDWIAGDAMTRDDVMRAARGVGVIVHAVNPPGYRHWDRLVLPMIDNTIAAARAVGGVRIVLPGTVYNFDATTTPMIGEDSPQHPRSSKGKIRKEMERRLEDVSNDVPVLILRAGDFFGPRAGSSWFAQAMVKRGAPVRRIVTLTRSVGHSWAYLPDLAQAFAQLLDNPERLRGFERLQFAGLWDPDGTVLVDAIRTVAADGRIPTRAFPWGLMRLMAPFGGFPREANDIAPCWRHPVRLDNTRLVGLLGTEPQTTVLDAVRDTLAAMGCVDIRTPSQPMPTAAPRSACRSRRPPPSRRPRPAPTTAGWTGGG